MTTSKKDASTAGKLLSSAKTPKKVKSVAGSDLVLNDIFDQDLLCRRRR